MAIHPLAANQRAKEANQLIRGGKREIGFKILLEMLKEDPRNSVVKRALTTLAMSGDLKYLQLQALRDHIPGTVANGKFILADYYREENFPR